MSTDAINCSQCGGRGYVHRIGNGSGTCANCGGNGYVRGKLEVGHMSRSEIRSRIVTTAMEVGERYDSLAKQVKGKEMKTDAIEADLKFIVDAFSTILQSHEDREIIKNVIEPAVRIVGSIAISLSRIANSLEKSGETQFEQLTPARLKAILDNS